MSVFRSRPALRWLVPSAAAVAVIGGGAAAGTIVATADPSLPQRSAAQLLVDLQSARVDGFSGTIVESADLGLPSLSGLTGGQSGAPSGIGDLASLIGGSNTARVWYAGETQNRVALVGTSGETDLIHNGRDVWLWRSSDNTATHLVLPAKDAAAKPPARLSHGVPPTPQEAADAALKAIDPTTSVTTTGAAKVAGRDAYELVLAPKAAASLVGQVRLAIDAKQHLPLRVDVYAKNATSPAIRVAFQQISFVKPDAQQFAFLPPPGAKVTTHTAADGKGPDGKGAVDRARPDGVKPGAVKPDGVKPGTAKPKVPDAAGEPQLIGSGWASVVEMRLPKEPAGKSGQQGAEQNAMLTMLEKVNGSWGSGRVFAGTLFSVLVTDDGRVFAGLVAPETLYQAAATHK